MILAVDVGNTTTSLGIMKDVEPVESWRISTTTGRTPDELALILGSLLNMSGVDREKLSAVSICSVVPESDPLFNEVIRAMFGIDPFFLTSQNASGLRIVCDRPEEVGADRIANSLAAMKLFGCPAVVVDFGTATTFDVVSQEGEYIGGVIAPGVSISAEQLSRRTAKLPMVAMDIPGRVIGRNTIESIRSGLFYGTIGSVNGILNGILGELNGESKVICTGGYARLISPHMKPQPVVDSDLTLKGLALAAEAHPGDKASH
jgi:type III pantothenate kinase